MNNRIHGKHNGKGNNKSDTVKLEYFSGIFILDSDVHRRTNVPGVLTEHGGENLINIGL
jgi:hypothetical protein